MQPAPPAAETPPDKPPRRGIARFVLVFAGCVALYYVLSGTTIFRDHLFPGYLRLNARVTAAALGLIGQQVTVNDNCVLSRKFFLTVERGCDAIEPTMLLIAAVIASPVAWRSRLVGIVFGTLALAVLNILRLITLYLTGVYWPAAFEIMHVDVWQAIFIFLALLLWIIWALRAIKPKPVKPDGSN
jgi:exosortase H (IPTLxxWG-CTERM-specific)